MLYYLERNEENTKRASNMEWNFFEIFLSSQTAAAAVASVVEGTSIGGMSKEGKKYSRAAATSSNDEMKYWRRRMKKDEKKRISTQLLSSSTPYLICSLRIRRRRKTTNDFSFNISCKLSYFLELLLSPPALLSLSLKCRYLTLKCSLDCLNCTRLYRSCSSLLHSAKQITERELFSLSTRKFSEILIIISVSAHTHTLWGGGGEKMAKANFPLSFCSLFPTSTLQSLVAFPFHSCEKFCLHGWTIFTK